MTEPAWSVRLATPADDAALRSLVARVPMAGSPRIAQEREPSFFALPKLSGAFDTYVVEQDGRVVGCGTHTVRDAWVDGRLERVGHVGDLRLEPHLRGRSIVRAMANVGLERSRKAHGATLSTMAAMASNRKARRAARQGETLDAGGYRMVNVPWRARPGDGRAVAATEDDLGEVAALLEDVQRGRLFGWHADERTLRRRVRDWPGLAASDFLLVRDDGGELVGCAAAWDPHPVRQTRVQAWGPLLGAYRPVARPRLPPAGGVLRIPYLTHLAVRGDDPRVLRSLVLGALARPRSEPAHALAVMVPEGSPLRAGLRGLGATSVAVRLLALAAPGHPLPAFADSPVGIEMALA